MTRRLTSLLLCAAEDTDKAVSLTTEDVIGAFLHDNSETEDNVAAAHLIEYGEIIDPGTITRTIKAIKVKGKPITIADVLWEVEELPLHEKISTRFPDITEEEWGALMRFAVVILSSLESQISPAPLRPAQSDV